MSGEDGMTEQADGRWRHGETDRGRGEDCVSGRGRGKAKRLRRGGLSNAKCWREQASTRQSCRHSGMVLQAKLKYKWKFSLSRINAILGSEKGGLEE